MEPSIGVVVPSRLHAFTKLVDVLAAMRSLSQFYVGICRIVNPRVELRISHYPVRNRAGSECVAVRHLNGSFHSKAAIGESRTSQLALEQWIERRTPLRRLDRMLAFAVQGRAA